MAFWGLKPSALEFPVFLFKVCQRKSLVSLLYVQQSGSTGILFLSKGFILIIMDRYSFPCSPSPFILWVRVGLNWKAFKVWSLVSKHGLSIFPQWEEQVREWGRGQYREDFYIKGNARCLLSWRRVKELQVFFGNENVWRGILVGSMGRLFYFLAKIVGCLLEVVVLVSTLKEHVGCVFQRGQNVLTLSRTASLSHSVP